MFFFVIGTVKDGRDWFSVEFYQNTTFELHATIAVDISHEECVWSDQLVPVTDNFTWTLVSHNLLEESQVRVRFTLLFVLINYNLFKKKLKGNASTFITALCRLLY